MKKSYCLFFLVVIGLIIFIGCNKDDNTPSNDITDNDGNIYHSVTIGTQTWMVENLKTTKYNDGTTIPLVTDITSWGVLTTPAYCWYNNDKATYKSAYGALYNWYAVNTGKLAPAGWHVATNDEWSVLIDFLGVDSLAGGKLKESGLSHWQAPNTNATNEYGFTALPGGVLDIKGFFGGNMSYGFWWSSTEDDTIRARFTKMTNYYGHVYQDYGLKQYGFSVRCLKD